uniref:Cyclin N-terminal domain-containing protein n=1 Tax=Setaria viridis TaxID=4556 RepID=A0A4U6W5Y0_SETVI|nr:hypothetical protein SEVIR_1G056700v2 [Setaria viridis]
MQVEPRRRPRSDKLQTILVDWLVEVAEEYKLVANTLYLAICRVDRFLSANALSRNRLQLLASLPCSSPQSTKRSVRLMRRTSATSQTTPTPSRSSSRCRAAYSSCSSSSSSQDRPS